MNTHTFRFCFLASIAILCIASRLSSAEDSRPLPPTRLEEMKQRFDAYVQRGGDARAKGLIDLSKEAMSELESSARRMMEIYSALDSTALNDIKASSSSKVHQLIANFSDFQSAAQIYFDTLKIHRDVMTASINAVDPNLTAGTLAKTEKNYNLTREWGASAIAAGKASLAYLQPYEKDHTDSTQAFNDMVSTLKHYEELQNTVLSISKANQRKLEKDFPR